MTRDSSDKFSAENIRVKAIPICHLLNFAFHVMHISVIVFTLFGWALKEIRFANLILILLTLGSWHIFKRWIGVGYCSITDWYWKIRQKNERAAPHR